MPLVLGFGVGLLGTLALALARYDAAVALGVFLLAAVRIEPAPSDLVFGVSSPSPSSPEASPRARAAEHHAARQRIPRPQPHGLDRGDRRARAVTYFGITLYLGIFALWFAAYVCSVRRARLVLLAYLAAAALSAAVACLALFTPFPGPTPSSAARARRGSSRTRTSSGRSSSPPR